MRRDGKHVREAVDRQEWVGASRRDFLHACAAATAGATFAGRVGLAAAAMEGSPFRLPEAAAGVADFGFFHVSDSHLDPRLADEAYDPASRSVQTLAWIARRTSDPIEQPPYEAMAGPPAFAIHTGDVFEYSLIDETWSDLETAVAGFECPLAPVPGNHDNTWGQINGKLQRRFGGDSYSFDYGGCHFVCLNSAGFLDALPVWDRRVLRWLAEDLREVPRDRPVILAMHHPLTGDAGYASEFDKLRFWDVVKRHHVALILDGHWHTVHRRQWQGIDRVNGGATFGLHTGYNAITVLGGVLRVVFNYEATNDERSDQRMQVPLLEKSLSAPIDRSASDITPVVPRRVEIGEDVVVRIENIGDADVTARAWIDDAERPRRALRPRRGGLSVRLPAAELAPGWHYATVRVRSGERPAVDHGSEFWLEPPASAPYRVRHYQAAAGIRTRPLTVGELVLVGDTAGAVTALSRELEPQWQFSTDSQIVHSLAAANEMVLVGDVDGWLYALAAGTGEVLWKLRLPNGIYGGAAVDDGIAYVADGGGKVHAVKLDKGERVWSRRVADFGFEAQPLVHRDVLFCGAWDGRAYAVDRRSGETIWQRWCASCKLEMKTRYFGPADCTPVVVGETLLVADRGWRLGRFALDGEFSGVIREQVSGAAASAGGDAFYTRGLDHRLAKYSATGEVLWELETPLGRAPTPPLEQNGRVAVVSDTGLFALADAATGAKLFSLSISPSLFVHSGIGGDGENRFFAADMDGHVTAISVA